MASPLVETVLWTWILLDSGAAASSLPEITDRKFMEECVTEHNRARSAVTPPATDMLHMTWDEGLAVTARARAERCVSRHGARRARPAFPSVGENIWTGRPPSQFDVTRSIRSWVDEKERYSYERNGCGAAAECGHYTQVVWGSSYRVGCAAQLCTNTSVYGDRESVVFVCNYAPAGNVNGRRPYRSGDGACVDGLCRNQARDAQKRYDRDAPLADDGIVIDHYATVVIGRPVALSFTFITAYMVHYFYPDVFCCE